MSYSLQEFQSIKMYHCAYQGPCPRGFHIGSKAEWQALIDALNRLGVYTASAMPTVLNIPSAYYLGRSNGSLETRYGMCRFWTSTMESNTIAWAWGIDENNLLVFQQDKPGNAFSIRPFKDEPVVPDSSWTEFPYGVFKNTTLGLISIQNASNWITISDKNLGATNVGDKGLYYQFGNNHGFTVNPTPYYTSKVSNTQAYGPSNYYNDDHFVRVSSGNNWFTDTNNNIRGGVDTTSLYPTEAKEVWLGNHKVRPAGWTPGANTVAYYKFNGNLNDSANSNNLSLSAGTVSYGTASGGGKYAYFNTSTWTGHLTISPNFNVSTLTCMYWWQPKQKFSSGNSISVGYTTTANGSGIIVGTVRSVDFWGTSGFSAAVNTWYHLAITCGGGVRKFYVNGAYYTQDTYSLSGTQATKLTINNAWDTSASSFANNNYISELILENKTRTAQEISDYYNLTKGDYGL